MYGSKMRNAMNVYIYEMIVLCEEVESLYKEISFMVNDPYKENKWREIFPKINSIVLHSANLKKILIGTGNEKGFAKNRINYFSSYYDAFNYDEILKVDMRNSLEHYDERMDRYLGKYVTSDDTQGLLNQKENIFFNMVFKNRIFDGIVNENGINIEKSILLKCFIVEDMIYVIGDTYLNLRKINNEVSNIKGMLEDIIEHSDGNHPKDLLGFKME